MNFETRGVNILVDTSAGGSDVTLKSEAVRKSVATI